MTINRALPSASGAASMMKRIFSVTLAIGVTLSLTACENAKRVFGQTKRAPDEFAVYTRAPLSLPPDFGLRVPATTNEARNVNNPRDIARGALGATPGNAVAPGDASPGEMALLQAADAGAADPDIRAIINQETTLLAAEDQTLADKVLFWREPEEPSVVVDAAKEAQRIQENSALGKTITDGETPVIERRSRALLEGLFN